MIKVIELDLDKMFSEFDNSKIDRKTFDDIAQLSIKAFEHRLGNTMQIASLNSEMFRRQKKATEELQVKFQEQRVLYEQLKAKLTKAA